MLRLIVAIIIALALAYFAVQNTRPATLMLAGYEVSDTPLYIIVLGSILLGLAFGLMFHILYRFSSSLSLRGKEKDLKAANKTITDLTKRVHTLELENAELLGKSDEEAADDKSL